MLKTKCRWGTALITSLQSYSPNSTSRFLWQDGQKWAITRKGQKILMVAIPAYDPGKTVVQITTV